jgi:hypothetical protein
VVPNDLAVDDAVRAIRTAMAEFADRRGLVMVSPVDSVVSLKAPIPADVMG